MRPTFAAEIFVTTAEETGVVVWEETGGPKIVGSNPSVIYSMEIFHIYLL